MTGSVGQLGFDHIGIGNALHKGRLKVPLNQREYSWESDHVTDLFQDFSQAINENKTVYFLGTLVLTSGEIPEVVDGQQRLATTTILISAIRDYLFEKGEEELYRSLENDFLLKFDRTKREYVPRLSLNVEDNEFFRKKIITKPDSKDRDTLATKESHKKIEQAFFLAKERVNLIVEGLRPQHAIDHLMTWVEFINEKATVIVLTVSDEMNAYMMFETLNDRGLRTSQADLLKNYLFGNSQGRLSEAQQKWSSMASVLESLGINEIVLTYLRHVAIGMFGPTREKEIFEKIQSKVSGPTKSLEFLDSLAKYADDYVAILTPTHKKWNSFSVEIRGHIEVMGELRVAQIRPLMLAVANHFSVSECTKAFRRFVFWTVRFLIAGGMRGGQLEDAYGKAANFVVKGDIKTANQLKKELIKVIPTDEQFKSAFSTARVSQIYLARYYLRAIEAKKREADFPELTPIKDAEVVNLEHILPSNPGKEWGHLEPEIADAFYKRVGNMALLNARKNSSIGNNSFKEKWVVFKESDLELTKQIANSFSQDTEWGPNEINERQEDLAEIAVKTWPIN